MAAEYTVTRYYCSACKSEIDPTSTDGRLCPYCKMPLKGLKETKRKEIINLVLGILAASVIALFMILMHFAD